MKIAAAYIRVSTDQQTELSPDSQLKEIRKFAKNNGYIVPDEYVFQDDGISGRTAEKRPEFNRMIGTAKVNPKPFEAILLWKFSRFARNREDSIVYKSMLRKQCGIDVISISENVGDDKMAILIEALIEAMDEYYSINLSEEVQRGMMEKFMRGKKVSAPPIGYKIIDNKFIIDKDNAILVEKIFNLYVNDNMGCLNIARHLNDCGYRTKTGRKFENRTVEYILRNPVYAGMQRWTPGGNGSNSHYNSKDINVIVVEGNHESIVSMELFETAQEKIKHNKLKYGRHGRIDSVNKDYMLRGLVKCSNCGSTLTITTNGLQCYKYTHGKCDVSHCINLTSINSLVINDLHKAFINDDIKIICRPKADETLTKDISELIKREQEKLLRVKEAYENGIDTIDEYRVNKQVITSRIDELIAEQEEINTKPVMCQKEMVDTIRSKLHGVLKVLKSDTTETSKNQALHEIIDRIVFNRTKSEIRIFYFV